MPPQTQPELTAHLPGHRRRIPRDDRTKVRPSDVRFGDAFDASNTGSVRKNGSNILIFNDSLNNLDVSVSSDANTVALTPLYIIGVTASGSSAASPRPAPSAPAIAPHFG